MRLKTLLLGAAALMGSYSAMAQEAQEEQWYLIGSFCDWDFNNAVEMTRESSTRYTVTMEKLEGEFKFAQPGWVKDYSYDIDVTGNCSFYLNPGPGGENLSATKPLENVTITLRFESAGGGNVAARVTFSGLPTDMEVPDEPTKLSSGSPLFYDLSIKNPRASRMTQEEDGSYTYTSGFEKGDRFVIADASFRYPAKMDSTARWTYLRDFEYGPAATSEGPVSIYLDKTFDLKYPAGTDAIWEIAEDGIYSVKIDPKALTLSLENPVWDDMYICGDVQNPYSEKINGFTAPSEAYKEFYDENFKLTKKVIGGKTFYQGRFRLVPKTEDLEAVSYSIDYYPQLRFFRALLGWVPTASLGSDKQDFFCRPMPTNWSINEPISWDMVQQGLGNWGFPIDEKTPIVDRELEITIEYYKGSYPFGDSFFVTFGPYDFSGLEEIDAEESNVPAVWYNTQGVRVSNPGKGLYIRVSGNKCEKVIR